MRPIGYKCTENSTSKGYSCAHETFKKYGKEIEINDYVQAGKEGTIAKEIVNKAGGITSIMNEKAMEAMKECNPDIVIDMNMDPYTANQMLKCGKIAMEKIQKEQEIKEEFERLKQESIKENEGGNE